MPKKGDGKTISPVQSDLGKQKINSANVAEKIPENNNKISNNDKVQVKVDHLERPGEQRLSDAINANNNNLDPLQEIHPPQFHHAPLHHLELPPASQLAAIHQKEIFRPIGFVILPRASEPTLAATEKITWCQCCFQLGWNSLIFHEIWVSHFCFPLILTLGASILTRTFNEWKDQSLNFKTFSPLSNGIPSLIAGILLVVTAVLLWYGSLRRVGEVMIACICLLGIGILLLVLTMGLAHVNSSKTAVNMYVREYLFVHSIVGEEVQTKTMDEIQMQFKCCGVDGPKDWLRQPFVNPHRNTSYLPISCCCLPKLKGARCFSKSCHFTTNKSDHHYRRFHRTGCVQKITAYLKHYYNIHWPLLITTVLGLILSLLSSIFYVTRVYARLAVHVHPHVRSLVDELVDKADDDVFGFGTGADLSEFDDQVRDYIHYNLSQCRTIEEVQQFLTATSDVHHYIRHLEPRELVTDILSGRPVLLHRFQKKLESMKAQISQEERVESQQESNKKYRRQTRARKDLHFLSKRIEHYKSFIDRVQQYHRLKLITSAVQKSNHDETPTPITEA